MPDPTERPNAIPWPPLIYVGFAVAGVVLHRLLPLPWPEGVPFMVLAAAGLCLICAGVALELVTALTFRRHRTTILPHRGATALITDGPFAKSRNPIYVGNTLLLLGAGLLFGIAWFIPAALAAAFTTQKLAIEREERHLAARFGKAWEDYAARTPRWLFVK
jgi:protein-S-isoprenylcysteine O-methyltransferase Ste14